LTYNCRKIEQLVILGLRFYFGIQCPRFLFFLRFRYVFTPSFLPLAKKSFSQKLK